MQINQATLAALFKGYRVQFLTAYQGAAPLWMTYAMRTSSLAAQEIYHWLGAIPGMSKLVDEIQIKNLAAHNFAIANDEFEDTIAVKQADIERDTYGIYNPLFQSMGLAAAQHPDELLANLFINGFTQKCYTGKNFFDNNHQPQAGKTAFSNLFTKKLSSANFEAARASIKGRLNAAGRPMGLGKDLVLVVSPANESLGRQILQADFIQTTANAQGGVASVTNVNKGTARLEIWPQLSTAPDKWFLLEAGYPVKPFIMQFEKEANAVISLTNPEADHVFKKHEFLYQCYGRYQAGYALPELACGSTGVDAA